MTTYSTNTYSIIVKPDDEPNFSELATIVGMDDDGGGIYLTVQQSIDAHGPQTIRIDPNNGELEAIILALQDMACVAKRIGDQLKGN